MNECLRNSEMVKECMRIVICDYAVIYACCFS